MHCVPRPPARQNPGAPSLSLVSHGVDARLAARDRPPPLHWADVSAGPSVPIEKETSMIRILTTLARGAGLAALALVAALAAPASAAIVINEIDYDQPGTDAAEFIE